MARAFLALAIVFSAVSGMAQEAQKQSENFEDWNLYCPAKGDTEQSRDECRFFTTLSVPGPDNETSLHTTLSISKAGKDQYGVRIRLPNNLWLPHGVGLLSSEEEELASLDFLVCNNGLCDAGGLIDTPVIEKLREESEKAIIRYRIQSNRLVKVAFSMRGFDEAVNAASAD